MSAVAIVAACAQEELPENGNKPAGEAVCYVSARTCDTKAYLEEKSDGVYKVLWAPEDKVSVNGNESVSADLTEDKSSATFGFSTELSDPVDMVYPSSVVTGYSERAAQVSLPASQKYVSGSFDPASGLVFGSGTKAAGVTLDHAMAYMKVVPAIASDHEGHNIASFSITTAGEAVSGDFTLDFAEKTLTAAAEGTGTSVTVKCDESGVASGNGIIIAIPAQTYAAGMKMTLTDTQGCTYTATSSRALEAVAGKIYTTELAFDPLLVEENYYDFGEVGNVTSPEVSSTNTAITVVYADGTEFPVSKGSFREGDSFRYVVVSGEGEYITFPAVEGKCLTSVRILTSGSTRSFAIAGDTEGTIQTGGDKFEFSDSENDHTWNLEGTLVNTPYYGVVPSDGSKTTMTIRKLWLTYEEAGKALVAEPCEQRSSTLSFKWKYNDGTSPANVAYTVNLYDSSDNLVRSHTYPTTGDIVRKFVFAGLDQNTTYKFEVVDPDGIRSEKVSATTKPFTVVTIPEQPLAPSASNVTILAENMSQLCYEGDKTHLAAGYRPTTLSLHSPDYTVGSVVSYDIGHGLFTNTTYKTDEHLNQTRFTGWAWENNASLIVNAGYFKLGSAQSYSNMFTPMLACIPQGYSAKLKVTVTLARYNHTSEKDAVAISLVEGGTVATNKALTGYETIEACPLTIDTGFKDYECEIDGATCDSRIMVGPDFDSDESVANRRIMFAGIKIEVLSLDLTGVKDIDLTKVYYSEATVGWDKIESVDSYNVYLDEVKINKEPLTEPSMHITGLKFNTEYSVAVSAVQGQVEKISQPVEFTTRNVWLYEAGPTHVCVQWDDISAYTLTNGSDRAYEMVLYKDEACTQVHASLYPFNGVLANAYAFAGSAWLGKTANVANMYDTRVSFGMLQPETTYWFRVRSLASVSVNKNNGDPVVLTNAAGDSQWSDPLPVTTKPVHVSGSKEVIYQGFDHFSIGRDMHNQCVGASPKITTPSDRLGFASLDSYDGEWVCQEMAGSYRIDEWGFASLLEGADEDYLTGKVFNGMWNYVGTDGWHYGQYHNGSKLANMVFAEMGYLHVDSKLGTYVGTPQLYNNLSAEGTECTLTFKGFANFASYNTNTAKPLILKIYRAATKTVEDVTCPGIPYKYTNASPSSTDFCFDISWKTVSKDITLYPGDAVIIVNNGASRFMIDDITIVAK